MITEAETVPQRNDAAGVAIIHPIPAPQRREPEPGVQAEVLPEKAIEVLALAQRTADDHIAEAKLFAQRVREEAQKEAVRIQGEARAYAAEIRAEADHVLAGARAEAERIVAAGTDYAEQLRIQAQSRYEDAVGGLSNRREALQKQIEALAQFDNEYRHRIMMFLQSQLRALWAEQPRTVDVLEVEAQERVPGDPVESARRH